MVARPTPGVNHLPGCRGVAGGILSPCGPPCIAGLVEAEKVAKMGGSQAKGA